MTDIEMRPPQVEAYEEFEYQLLYLRPSEYADERIVIGAVAEFGNRIEARFVSAPSAIDLMARLFGEEGVEQFQFAASELRRAAARSTSLDSFVVPTDLITTGERTAAYTKDRQGLMSNVLATTSLLLRADSRAQVSQPLHDTSTTPFARDIFEHVSQLNPLVAGKIFDQKVTVQTGETVALPIFGSKIFGAPVSFAGRQHHVTVQSYVAKFRWLSSLLSQLPRVYVFKSPHTSGEAAAALDRNLRELCAIAEASDVLLRIAESKGEIAAQILQDEAANEPTVRRDLGIKTLR